MSIFKANNDNRVIACIVLSWPLYVSMWKLQDIDETNVSRLQQHFRFPSGTVNLVRNPAAGMILFAVIKGAECWCGPSRAAAPQRGSFRWRINPQRAEQIAANPFGCCSDTHQAERLIRCGMTLLSVCFKGSTQNVVKYISLSRPRHKSTLEKMLFPN